MNIRALQLTWIGSTLLAATSLFHLTGFPAIPEPGAIDGPTSFFDASLQPLWLFAGLHWLLIAVISILAAKSGQGKARVILRVCACVVIADALVLYWFIGAFAGVALLAMSGFAILMASFGKFPSLEKHS